MTQSCETYEPTNCCVRKNTQLTSVGRFIRFIGLCNFSNSSLTVHSYTNLQWSLKTCGTTRNPKFPRTGPKLKSLISTQNIFHTSELLGRSRSKLVNFGLMRNCFGPVRRKYNRVGPRSGP